ncbi:uncharacterized protein ACBR49_019619 [Aulostomus maculatus]
MAAVSTIALLLLLCSCSGVASTDPACDAHVATGRNFAVSLNYTLTNKDDLRWKHNGMEIFHQRQTVMVNGNRDSIYENGSLKLTRVKKSNAGNYTPEVYDENGRHKPYLKKTVLCVIDAVSRAGLRKKCLGSNVTFTCVSAQSNKDATIEWIQNGKVVKGENRSTLVRLAEDVKEDSFQCKISNPVSSSTSEAVTQDCVRPSLFGLDFWIMVSILAGGGGLVLLLIITVIVCCIRNSRKKRARVKDEEELRLGWSQNQQQQQLQKQQYHQQRQQQHHRHQHGNSPSHHQHHHCHQQLPAGNTGPRPQRKKQPRNPQRSEGQPQPLPQRPAQNPRQANNEEHPPPLPQPRKTISRAPKV